MILSGDVAFLFFASVFILFMTPAVAYFYGGLVTEKFTNTMIMQTFFAIPLITLVWGMLGFSLAYGDSVLGGFCGNLDFACFRNLLDDSRNIWAPGVPLTIYFVVQLTFAVITPALIIGALIGRLRFKPFVAFFVLWSLLVYSPLIHWVWGGGFLSRLGYIDFAGGLPVHGIAGFSSLAAVFAIGNRKRPEDGPSNLMYVAIGVGILYAGWLIFNASAALGANATACLAAVNTLISSSAGCVAWLLLAYHDNKKITVTDVIFGAFAGLVISTPTGGFVLPWVMLPAGFLGGVACYYGIVFRIRRNWDDSLDVWGLHGVAGFLGVLLLGLFAHPDLAPVSGSLYGNPGQIGIEALGLLIGGVYCFVITFVMVKIINRVSRFRRDDEAPEVFE